jgi:hypothetical protein
MMGRGAFILLKANRLWPKNAEQAKIQLAILLKILPIDDSEGRSPRHGREISDGLYLLRFPRDMANLSGIVRFVIWFTVLTRKLTQYRARECLKKDDASIDV